MMATTNPTFRDAQNFRQEVEKLERDPYDLWDMFPGERQPWAKNLINPLVWLNYVRTPAARRVYCGYFDRENILLTVCDTEENSMTVHLQWHKLPMATKQQIADTLKTFPSVAQQNERNVMYRTVGSWLTTPR